MSSPAINNQIPTSGVEVSVPSGSWQEAEQAKGRKFFGPSSDTQVPTSLEAVIGEGTVAAAATAVEPTYDFGDSEATAYN